MSLFVYKSSAGSGKTTTLVNEYLKIALEKPTSFRHILAITFTNKAASEMKTRVIETLKELIDKEKKPSPKLSGLLNELNLDSSVVQKRAETLLTLILHNYDEFAISTIDSFIHRIIRTFATDIQLPQNFEVVIDDDEIIPDIIQNLYNKVGSDKEITKLLIDFVMNQANEEKSYDPTNNLVEFIKHHMNEDGFHHLSKLDNLNTNDLRRIINRLQKKISSEKSIIKNAAKDAIAICQDNNLDKKDFYQGSRGILAYFDKISEFKVADEKLFPGLIIQETISKNNWFSKKTSPAVQDIITSISPQLTDIYYLIISTLSNYFFHRLIFSKIYSLSLIHEIRSLFVDFTEETAKVHISEFNKKISNEIADQPVPFIYERLGRKYRYFLIDEFQDTSVLQWQNLLPLIEESLSYNNFNMLVGDAKQAIYRFRSGEVELFTSLPDIYNNDNSQLSITRQNLLHQEYKEVVLSTNWRSYSEIIKFNNDFFKTIIETLSDRTKQIYQHLEQEIPNNGKTGGYVSLNFVEIESTEDYKEKKLKAIKEFVDELIHKEFSKKDICILCRTSKSAIDIAGHLLDNNYDVISSESLLLTNSPKVRLIIAFFKLLVYPDNELALAEFTDNYLKVSQLPSSFNIELTSLLNNNNKGVIRIFNHFKIKAKPSDIIALSPYEIAEFVLREIIRINTADVFVQYLLDFISESRSSLDKFLARWEDKKEKVFIAMPDKMDAIKIMTIHKAKGLDFQTVIIDAANIKNQNTKNEYWENINIKDFEELKVGLLPLSKKLEYIDRSNVYEEEVSKTELDFLNLIYVAFTRPVKALYAIGQTQSGGSKDYFSKFLISYLKTKGIWEENKLNYNFGELDYLESNIVDNDTKSMKLVEFISSSWTNLITVAASEDISKLTLASSSSRTYGNLIHNILSDIYTFEDINRIIKRLTESNNLTSSEVDIIKGIITDVVTTPQLEQYFQSNQIIKNETEVLLENGELVRPDRVIISNNIVTIIDYKTGEEKNQHHNQIKKYKDAFSKLGFEKINLKLVYIGDLIRIVEVV